MNKGYDDLFQQLVETEEQKKQAYIKESQQNREKCKELSKRMTEAVAKSGTVLKRFLDAQAHFDRYSPNNVLLVMAQKPDATQLGDYQFWKNKKIWILKEELQNPILILEPGKEYVKTDGSHGRYYNAKKLYDISQTASKDQPVAENTYDERLLIRALVNNPPVEIISTEPEFMMDEKNAFFSPLQQKIFVRKGMSAEELFRYLAPEIMYAEIAKDYRDITKFECKTYEFQVYCAAYMLCRKYGVNTQNYNFGKAPEYFNDMDEKKVKAELSKMRNSMDKVSGRMQKVLEVDRAGKER